MDIRLQYNTEYCIGEIVLQNNGIVIDNTLQTAVFISLFTDARSGIEGKEEKGWWGNTVEGTTEELGSTLWLLEREKVTPETIFLAKEYTTKALQWLQDTNLVKNITVEVDTPRNDAISINIVLTLPNKEQEAFSYSIGGV